MRVLFVCTGNICRSPTAEAILRERVAEAGLEGRVEVESCGIAGSHVGEAPSPLAVERASLRGYDLSALRARLVKAADFRDFDLVLAMGRDHVTWLSRLNRGGARVERFLEYASDGRRRKDVPDPFGGSAEDYESALDLLESAMPDVLDNLQRDFPEIFGE